MTDSERATGGELHLSGVQRSYGGHRGVEGVNLTVRPGEFLTMLGPSGSGKTTTLNLVAGFLEPDAGSIALDGRQLAGIPAHRRDIGVVFQNYALFPHMTAAQNIGYPLRVRGVRGAARAKAVQQALDLVRLSGHGNRRPAQLSGGQQQRVALARALVFGPRLLLMDEPLGALDKKLRDTMQIEITRICREIGATVLYVTHDQHEALTMSDRIALYDKGRIVQTGTAEDLYERPASLFAADFVGESSVLHGTCDGGGFAFAGHRLAVPPDCALDGPAALVLRPENVEVHPAEGGGAVPADRNRVPGTVAEWIYLGSARKCLVECAGGTTVAALAPAGTDPGLLPRGAPALVTWHPKAAVAVSGPGPAPEPEAAGAA